MVYETSHSTSVISHHATVATCLPYPGPRISRRYRYITFDWEHPSRSHMSRGPRYVVRWRQKERIQERRKGLTPSSVSLTPLGSTAIQTVRFTPMRRKLEPGTKRSCGKMSNEPNHSFRLQTYRSESVRLSAFTPTCCRECIQPYLVSRYNAQNGLGD